MENFTMDSFEVKRYRIGEKVKGTVVSVSDKTIYLDIHAFTEGTMHLDHYTKDKSITSFNDIVKVGDEITCEIAKVNEENIYLSRLNQINFENFKQVVSAAAENKNIVVKIVSEVKDKGFVASFMGNSLFMPKSQSTPLVKVGAEIEVRVLEADEDKNRAIISRRVIEQEVYQENKAKELDSINIGDVLTGEIVKVEKFGAFVRFNFNQGLLKTNQVAHTFIDITKELHVGDKIEVKVVGKENGKLDLSRKALLKTPFEEFAEAHKVGETITGTVVNKLAFGLLLEVAPNVKGLLHASEYSHNPNDNFNNCVIIGDKVEVAILAMNPKGEKISLSRKALIDNPWSKVNAKEGDLVDVKVTEIKENGLLVEALGVDGFVPASEATIEDKRDITLSQYYAVGDSAKAYILDIKPLEWKLKLSIKRYLKEEDRKSYEKYLSSEDPAGTNSNVGEMLKEVLKK